MNPVQTGNVSDAKELIKKLPVPPFEHSLSSFTSSRHQVGKFVHTTLDDSPEQDMSIFPSNNDPSIIFDRQSINMKKDREGRYSNQGREKVEQMSIQNDLLRRKVQELQIAIDEYARIEEEKQDSNAKMALQIKRLKAQIADKDKKNIQLYNANKALDQQIKASKQELEAKTKQLNSKSIELRKQKEKLQSAIKSKQFSEKSIKNSKNEELLQELARREIQNRKVSMENQKLANEIEYLNDELKSVKEHYLLEMRQQTNKYKLQAAELLDKLKSSQSVSRSNSIRGSNVSTVSLSQSFSAEMLSPQETVELIFNVLKKISKSQMMQKILYSNPSFVSLIRELLNKS